MREAFPSRATGVDLTEGLLARGEVLRLRSEMTEGGLIFGDGMEGEGLDFAWDRVATLGLAERARALVRA